MGFLSGALGLNSSVQTSSQNPYAALQPYQQQANQLTNQLQTEAAGGGPNPAQQQYLQNSQQIAQQQATNYAQNRSLNPGLAARMAGNTAAQTGQAAAGNAAIQQAQQQLGAQSLLGSTIAQQEQAANQASGINAGVAAGNQQAGEGVFSGLLGGAGAALAAAHGGEIQKDKNGKPRVKLAMGGPVKMMAAGGPADNFGAPALQMPMMGSSSGFGFSPPTPTLSLGTSGAAQPKSKVGSALSGASKNMQSTGSPAGQLAQFMGYARYAHGGMSMKKGGHVPGKANVAGDSYKNDTVKAMLSPGEIVIPRTVAQAPDAPSRAAKFVAAVHGMKRRK